MHRLALHADRVTTTLRGVACAYLGGAVCAALLWTVNPEPHALKDNAPPPPAEAAPATPSRVSGPPEGAAAQPTRVSPR